jgi:multidrug efflux pump subunit AcrB
VEQALLQDPLITTVLSTLGADGEANKARLRVLAVPKQQRTIGIDALKDKVRALAMAVPRAKVVITEPAFVEGAGVQAPIMILVNGTSYDSLSKTARDIGLILESMAMGAMIGIILLMGLVTKNAILLVDRAIVRVREQGETPLQAILEAGPERLRPILMTSAAMVLGMLPTAISQGDGSEFRAPMAIAVIGGVISSTMLSLLVIPACYLGIENAKGWLAQKLGWKGKTSSPAAPAMPAATDSTASGAE